MGDTLDPDSRAGKVAGREREGRDRGRERKGRENGKGPTTSFSLKVALPHIEYRVHIRNPYLKRNMACLENIQKRAIRLLHGFEKKSCEQRLQTLTPKKIRWDLIET